LTLMRLLAEMALAVNASLVEPGTKLDPNKADTSLSSSKNRGKPSSVEQL
jgi:hypothetical protein